MKKFTLALLLSLAVSILTISSAAADEGWTITSFDASYVINPNGTVDVVEDIRVDFGPQQKHGILRHIRVEYEYDAEHIRRIDLDVTGVTDGDQPVPYETTTDSGVLTLQIGDPDVLVSGPQRYRIVYRLTGALNPQESTDEFFWNVTGNEWPVRILQATATVTAPAIADVTCYQGSTGSTRQCASDFTDGTAQFTMTQPQAEGGGLTIVVALPQGAVEVGPPMLVDTTIAGRVRAFFGLTPVPIILAVLLAIAGVGGVLRYWWLEGRDRWLGDIQYLTGDEKERHRPPFARNSVVVEYGPPQVERRGRRYRPAELGTLLDESADTLDVSATIVDLAVRGYLRITEIPKKQWLFGDMDYKLERLKPNDDELLPYESLLLDDLFEDGDEVLMSDLKGEFYTTLRTVKKELYTQVVSKDHLFPTNPEWVRTVHTNVGFGVVVLGVAAIALLGIFMNAGIVGVPIVLAGLLLLVLSRSMSRRTGTGRELYRRTLGFRRYMTVAETDRQRFNEQAGLFQEYLPYAIVFSCVDKWAQVFEDLGIQPRTDNWYVSTHAFAPLAFSHSLHTFSSSMSSAIASSPAAASTPGGSGFSGFGGGGFSGGGFSGGGMGGGGGGSW